jgi:hypothetical protein
MKWGRRRALTAFGISHGFLSQPWGHTQPWGSRGVRSRLLPNAHLRAVILVWFVLVEVRRKEDLLLSTALLPLRLAKRTEPRDEQR